MQKLNPKMNKENGVFEAYVDNEQIFSVLMSGQNDFLILN